MLCKHKCIILQIFKYRMCLISYSSKGRLLHNGTLYTYNPLEGWLWAKQVGCWFLCWWFDPLNLVWVIQDIQCKKKKKPKHTKSKVILNFISVLYIMHFTCYSTTIIEQLQSRVIFIHKIPSNQIYKHPTTFCTVYTQQYKKFTFKCCLHVFSKRKNVYQLKKIT